MLLKDIHVWIERLALQKLPYKKCVMTSVCIQVTEHHSTELENAHSYYLPAVLGEGIKYALDHSQSFFSSIQVLLYMLIVTHQSYSFAIKLEIILSFEARVANGNLLGWYDTTKQTVLLGAQIQLESLSAALTVPAKLCWISLFPWIAHLIYF